MGSDALIVVLSAATASTMTALARSGWPGPVLVVGSVEEARQAIGGTATVEDPGPVEASRPLLTTVPPVPASSRADRSTGRSPGLVLDADRRVVITHHGDRGLTPLEFGVLQALLDEPGRVWCFEELTRTVWGTRDVGDWTPVHAVVRRLRGKLERVHAPAEIVAVRGVGFRLDEASDQDVADHAAHCPSCASPKFCRSRDGSDARTLFCYDG